MASAIKTKKIASLLKLSQFQDEVMKGYNLRLTVQILCCALCKIRICNENNMNALNKLENIRKFEFEIIQLVELNDG